MKSSGWKEVSSKERFVKFLPRGLFATCILRKVLGRVSTSLWDWEMEIHNPLLPEIIRMSGHFCASRKTAINQANQSLKLLLGKEKRGGKK